ncbi:hypothetical protein EQM14_13205 [Caproiciproducens sp. NJN-50]|uniref:hypothetical protein n=1 Tax=Acutalibacteraceae TaxID=3082771 RepID=UPI000FFE083A|nr:MULTISPECIES: hypothetical protein [Acutalibacteraceae]QAT50640.1 hypothetical protein EQM14_13205 [Caproiciproducens sp. NJN-50]
MATEIVDAIKKTESDAQKAEEQAAEQCDVILQDARREAAEAAGAMLEKAKREARALLDEADSRGGEMKMDVQSKIASQVESMRQTALRRQDEAVRLVLSELI